MFCTKCGKMLPDDSRFCSACGNTVSNMSAPVHTAQPHGGSVYLRPPQHMQSPQSAPVYRPPVSPMQPPPAAPVYRPPVRPMQPQPATPVYQPPVRPMQPPPAAPVYQPPVQPPPAAPVYQSPIQPYQSEPTVVVNSVVEPEPIVNTPVKEIPVAEPVVADMPKPVEAPVAEPVVAEEPEVVEIPVAEPVVTEAPEPVEISMEEPIVAEVPEVFEAPVTEPIIEEAVPVYAEENRESTAFANEIVDIVESEATVSEIYVPMETSPYDIEEQTVAAVDVAVNGNSSNEQQNVFYTEPNVVYCEDDSKGKSAVKMIFKILSCVFAVIFAITTLLLVNLRFSLTADNVFEVVEETSIGGLIDERGGNLDAFCVGRISDNEMEDVLNQGPFKIYFGEVANGYVEYILGGDKPDKLSGENFAEVMGDNIDLVEDVTDYKFADFDLEYIEEDLNDSRELSRIYDNDTTELLRIILSPYVLIGLAVLTLLCLAGIVIFSEDKRKGFRLLGIILAVIAIVVFVALFVTKFIFAAQIYGELAKVIDILIGNVIGVSYISCGSLLGLGLIIFALSFIGRKKSKIK